MKHHLLSALLVASLGLASCAAGGDGRATKSIEPAAVPIGEPSGEIVYQAGGEILRGFLAKPEGVEQAPGVLVVHEWWGHNDYTRRRARELADLGYVAFAVDMYGDGKTAEHPDDATAFMNALMENEDAMQARFDAALRILRAQPEVDASRCGAIGYCMGGGIVLTQAVSGTDLNAIASFHGVIPSDVEPVANGGRTAVAIFTGGADPMVAPGALATFEEALDDADVKDVESEVYDGVVHGFTNPDATAYNERFGFDGALGYDAEADAKSWASMKAFFAKHL